MLDCDPIAPTFTSIVPGRLVKLIEPEERRGTYSLVSLDKCCNDIVPGSWCVQARGHDGPCWLCTEDLYLRTEGAWAKLVTDS
jgi:hypothetical protein